MVTMTTQISDPSCTNSGAKLSVPHPPRLSWPGVKPSQITNKTKLIAGPIYDLAIVQRMIGEGAPLYVVNDEAQLNLKGEGVRPMRRPVWGSADVRGFILSLDPTDYVNSQWCLTSAKAAIDCDAYAMTYNRTNRTRSSVGTKVYVKFGYSTNTDPSAMLICSIHPADR